MAYTATPQAAYRKGEVLAASPAQLVVLLYDGARRFLRKAALAMRAGEVETAHQCAAQRRTRDRAPGRHARLRPGRPAPAPALALSQFYLAHLTIARRSQDPAKIDEVNELLGELREAWAEVAAEAARA